MDTEGIGAVAPLTRQKQPARRSLAADVERFIGELEARYPERFRLRPKAFKARVLHLVARQLPPFSQPAGRPRDARITRARAMRTTREREVQEGKRKRTARPATARKSGLGATSPRFAGFQG